MGAEEMLFGFAMQLFWAAARALLSLFLWRRGIKKFIAAGG
jgi:ABC-type uncharacterized transport system permease subunit